MSIGPSDVTYNFKLSIAQISSLSGQPATAQSATVGLTQSQFRLATSWEGQTLQDSSSRMQCTRPSLVVDVSVGPQVVSVAREFPKGSCAFWEIANHELRHVQTNQAHAEQVAAELQSSLRSSFQNKVFYGTQEELRVAFTKNLSNEWLPWGRARFDTVKFQHAAIDTPAEYAKTAVMCDGEVARALSRIFP